MPEGFNLARLNSFYDLPVDIGRPRLWKPFAATPRDLRPLGSFNYVALGRLRSGVSAQRALDELNAVQADIARRAPEPAEFRAALVPMADQLTGRSRTAMQLALGTVGLVLLIACVNVTNLLLAQSAYRQREFAIRRAAGASLSRLVRQMLTEALVLATLAGVVGACVASGLIPLIRWYAPADWPRLDEAALDGQSLLFSFAVTFAAGVLVGMIPAVRFATTAASELLRASSTAAGSSRSASRLRSVLVTVEVAGSVVCLIVAALLVTSFINVLSTDRGFNADRVVTASLDLPQARYASADQGIRFLRALTERARSLPGVTSLGVTSRLPLTGFSNSAIMVEGSQLPRQQRPSAMILSIDGDYFPTMGIAHRAGRLLNDDDDRRRVALVSTSTGQRLWPNQDPVGKRFRFGPDDSPLFEVVGVVGDVRGLSLSQAPALTIYVPFSENFTGNAALAVKTSDSATVQGGLREIIRTLDPELAVIGDSNDGRHRRRLIGAPAISDDARSPARRNGDAARRAGDLRSRLTGRRPAVGRDWHPYGTWSRCPTHHAAHPQAGPPARHCRNRRRNRAGAHVGQVSPGAAHRRLTDGSRAHGGREPLAGERRSACQHRPGMARGAHRADALASLRLSIRRGTTRARWRSSSERNPTAHDQPAGRSDGGRRPEERRGQHAAEVLRVDRVQHVLSTEEDLDVEQRSLSPNPAAATILSNRRRCGRGTPPDVASPGQRAVQPGGRLAASCVASHSQRPFVVDAIAVAVHAGRHGVGSGRLRAEVRGEPQAIPELCIQRGVQAVTKVLARRPPFGGEIEAIGWQRQGPVGLVQGLAERVAHRRRQPPWLIIQRRPQLDRLVEGAGRRFELGHVPHRGVGACAANRRIHVAAAKLVAPDLTRIGKPHPRQSHRLLDAHRPPAVPRHRQILLRPDDARGRIRACRRPGEWIRIARCGNHEIAKSHSIDDQCLFVERGVEWHEEHTKIGAQDRPPRSNGRPACAKARSRVQVDPGGVSARPGECQDAASGSAALGSHPARSP